MGIFRRSPSPAVPAHTAAEASPSLDGASSSNDSKTSLDHAYHHHLHVDRAYHSTSSPAMPSSSSSPTLQPHAVDHHQQSQSRSRSRSPLFNDTSSTSTQQQIHTQRARSPALLTPSHYDGQASSSSSPIGHAYSTGTTTPIPSPQPGNTNNSNFGNATSPWASYLPEGQFTGASSSESSSSFKSRSKNKKDLKLKPNSSSNSSNNSATQSSNNDDSSSTRAMAESRSVECKRLQLLNNDDESSRKSKALDLARFSVNGMLNLVEQRMMMEEQEQSKQQTRHEYGAPTSRFANRAHGLGLSVSVGRSAPGFSATQRMGKYSPPSSRHMHTVGEEAESEEILSSSPSRAKAQTMQQAEGRHRTSSAASSDTTQLRDEVVDLLQLARKASSSSGSGSCITASTSSASAGSAAPSSSSARGLDSDSQSYTSRSSESSNALRQMVDTQHVTAKYAPGTASREELENLARAISPFPIPSTTSSTTTTKPKKKFGGLFGGGSSKKNDSSKEESKIRRSPSPLPMPSTMEATAISRSQSPLPTIEASPAATVLPQSSTQVSAGARRALHPPVAGAQRALVSAQHRRKRSMSVGDAVPFAILQSARQAPSSSSTQHNARNGTMRGQQQQQQQAHRLARPDVYDESYFSSSKMPYYHHLQATSLKEKKRSNQLGRLGISEDDLEVDVQVRHDEEESLQGAKERLLAQSRNVVAHPIASSPNSKKTETWQRKDGPHVGKVDEAQYATYHQDTKSGEVPSASASLSSMASSNASSSSSSSATSRETATKRRGQLVVQDDTTGQYKLRNDSSSSSQGQPQVNVTSWTTPSQPAPSKTENKTRINRSNSDASFIDPFLPHASSNSSRADAHPTSASNVRRPAQLAVPAHTTNMKHLAHTHTQDSVKAIGPPPASPLPSPPRTSSSLPSSRVPSPSHQVGLAPAPSPAPTSPLPPLPAAICSPPTKYNGLPLPPTRPPPAAPSSLPSSSTAKLIEKGDKDTKYDFELRPHRTKQQGRAKMSPLTERDRSPPLLETPALDRHTLGTPRLFGTKGIVQRPPSALDMTLLPSPSPSPSAAVIPAPICTTVQQPSSSASSSLSSSAASLSGSISSGSMITPKAREFNRDQIRRREETSTTVASQYSTEGDFESYDSSSSIASASASSAAMVERVHSNGSASSSSSSSSISGNCSSAAGHTTLSNTTSYSSSSMSSYVTRPSLSMDGHSTSSCSDDYSSVSTHDQQDLDSYRCLRVISPYDHPHHEHLQQQKHQKQAYTYTHVNDAVPLKPPRNMSKMTPSPSCESVNNLAGIGLAGASSNVVFPHSRRMHFGWSRHKAMRDLSSHAEVEGFDNDGEDYDIEHVRIGNGMTSPASPGSEDDDAYAGILSDYAKTLKLAKDDEGYMGSSPEMTSPTTSTTANVLSRSHGNSSARQKITHDRPTVKQARSFDQLKAYR